MKRSFPDNIPDSISDIESSIKRLKSDDVPDVEESREPVNFDEIQTVSHPDCFGCIALSPAVFSKENNNKKLKALFKLYSKNRLYLTTEGLVNSMHDFYQRVIFPDTKKEWTKSEIKEHIKLHTHSPTAEIIEQVQYLKCIRNAMGNLLFEKNSEGKMIPNLNNIKLFKDIQKDIKALLESNEKIPTMIGYNAQLKF